MVRGVCHYEDGHFSGAGAMLTCARQTQLADGVCNSLCHLVVRPGHCAATWVVFAMEDMSRSRDLLAFPQISVGGADELRFPSNRRPAEDLTPRKSSPMPAESHARAWGIGKRHAGREYLGECPTQGVHHNWVAMQIPGPRARRVVSGAGRVAVRDVVVPAAGGSECGASGEGSLKR